MALRPASLVRHVVTSTDDDTRRGRWRILPSGVECSRFCHRSGSRSVAIVAGSPASMAFPPLGLRTPEGLLGAHTPQTAIRRWHRLSVRVSDGREVSPGGTCLPPGRSRCSDGSEEPITRPDRRGVSVTRHSLGRDAGPPGRLPSLRPSVAAMSRTTSSSGSSRWPSLEWSAPDARPRRRLSPGPRRYAFPRR